MATADRRAAPDAESAPLATPPRIEAAAARTSIAAWLPRYAAWTMRTKLIELPESFVKYLATDGPMVLPRTAKSRYRRPAAGPDPADDYTYGWSDDDDDVVGDDDEEDSAPLAFPELERSVDAAIEALGGAAFAKLNWSAPRDAAWLHGGSLRCACAADVFGLLKASDRAARDVADLATMSGAAAPSVGVGDVDTNRDASDDDDDDSVIQVTPPRLTLALREFWEDLDPSMEFRCFARRGRLVAASQRRLGQSYDYDDARLLAIRARLARFFDDALRGRLAGSDVVFDAYLAPNGRAWLVDLAAWGQDRYADPLLFDWHEFADSPVVVPVVEPAGPTRPEAIELRVATDDAPRPPRTSSADATDDGGDAAQEEEEEEETRVPRPPPSPRMRPGELASSRAPFDVLDLAAAGGLEGLIDQVRRQTTRKSRNDDDDSDASSSDDDDTAPRGGADSRA